MITEGIAQWEFHTFFTVEVKNFLASFSSSKSIVFFEQILWLGYMCGGSQFGAAAVCRNTLPRTKRS